MLFVMLLCSCASSDHRNTIPAGCTMIASVNLSDKNASEDFSFLTKLMKMDDPLKSGIDVSKPVYLFETADGNFGMSAKVSDKGNLESYCETLVRNGMLKKGPERPECSFAVIADKFVAGWDDDIFVVLGPVLPSAQKEMYQQIANLLKQDEDESMAKTAMMEKLEAQTAPVAMVAQAAALPQQMAPLVSLGAPKLADATQVAFAAGLDIRGNMLVIEAEPFSESNDIDKALKDSYSTLRQIGDTFLHSMAKNDVMALFLNVDGKKFLPMLRQSPGFMALLTGVNQAIDFDAVVKSINGDMILRMESYAADKPAISMAANLGQSAFLNDVAYWKKSAPSGTTITDWKENAYCLQSPDLTFYFGVNNYTPLQFYGASSKEKAETILSPAKDPISDDVINIVKESRLAAVVSLASLLPSDGGMATLMLPSMMKVKYIVYTVPK